MKFNKQQQQVLEHSGSCLVTGGPGTGKTMLLLEKVARLVESGTAPADICIVVFTYRSMLVMRELLYRRLPDVGRQIRLGTMVDLPLLAMRDAAGAQGLPKVADNTVVRRLLRQAMREVEFKGDVQEAEHIMRMCKSRARKPSEDEPHYALFHVYKRLLEGSGLSDRHDLVRKHIIGMRNDLYGPVKSTQMLVDNFQDLTQIQLLWLVDHLKAGVAVTGFGCDDLCLFGRDGALGAKAFSDFTDLNDLPVYTLQTAYRLPTELAAAADGVVAPVAGREKGRTTPALSGASGELRIDRFDNITAELEHVAAQVRDLVKQRGPVRVGVLTRHDLQARWVEHVLREASIPYTSFARTVWETSGALQVLDLLEVLLNRSTNNKLRNVLSGFGLATQVIDALFSRGLLADGWLKRGAPLPVDVERDIPATAMHDLAQLRHQLLGYAATLRQAGPKNVFKAAVYDLVQKMPACDQGDALHALDDLLSMKGSLGQVLNAVRTRKDPNPSAKVVVAPVREVRGMSFSHVLLPFANSKSYPFTYKVLGADTDAERRLLYAALTRAESAVLISHVGDLSPFLKKAAQNKQESAA